MKRLRPPLDFQVAILYALFGGLWILFSDYLLSEMARDTATLTKLQTYKGWLFVAASALFIFILLRRELTLRQVAERQIGESEERYRLLFQNSMDAILLAGPDGSIHAANPAACMLFDRTEAEILQAGRNELVDTSDPRLAPAMEEREATGRFHGVLTLIRKDGSKFEGELTSRLFRTQDGLVRSSVMIRDITDRKRAEENLRLSEERFSKAFFASPAGMTITRIADGKFIDANESFLKMFDFSREEVVGHTSTELNMWTPEERHKLIEAQIETGGLHDFELQARAKSGRVISILFSSQPIDLEGEICHITTMIDITARMQVEWALQESERRFREMLENIQLLAVLLDLDGRVIFCNPYLLQLSGYTREEVVGCDWFTQFIPDARPDVKEIFLQGLAQGDLHAHYENPILTRSGEARLIRFNNTLLRDGEGNIIGSTSIGEDITEHRQAEEALRKSEQTYAVIFKKAPFAAGLARISDGAYLEVNEEFERLFGFGRQEIVGKTSLELGLYRDVEIRERSAAMFREQGFVHNLDVQLQTRTGQAHDVLINSDLVEIGGEKYILTTANDITERRRAEEYLRQSEKKYSLLFNKLTAPSILFKLPDVTIVEVNEAAENLLGYSRQEMLGKTTDALGIDRSADPAQRMATFGKQNLISRNEMRIFTKSGVERIIVSSTHPLELGGESYAISTMHDITESRHRAERIAFQTRLLQNVNDAIIATNDHFTILSWNRGAENIYGWKMEEVLGLNYAALLRSKNINRDWSQDGIAELLQRRKDGSEIYVDSRVSVLYDAENRVTGYLNINRDITERQHAEEALQMRANELAALYQSAQRLQKIFTLETLAEEIVDLLEKSFSYEFSAILLIDESSGRLIPFAVAGRERGAEFVKQEKAYINLHEPRLGKGITGWVAERGESLRLGDVQKDDRYYGLREDLHSELCVPLRAGDQVIGVINVETVKPDAYSAADQRILETLAAHISVAVQNARLLEESRLSRDRLAELSRQLVQAYETERRGIGRELHDQIGQMLTALDLILAVAAQLPPEQAARKFAGAQELVHDLSNRISRLSLELRPPMLDDLGLIPALLWHINRYQEQTNIAVDFKHSRVEGSRFRPEIENTAYRLIQEALTNVARHAHASQVRLELHAREGQFEIKIEDNGQGFNAQIGLAQHRGLSGMRERVGLLDGEFQIKSENEKGTRVLIKLPLKEG